MNEQANIDVVRQCYDAFNAGDIQRLLACFAPDIDWDIPEIEGVAFTGKRHGHDQVAQFFEQMSQMQESRGVDVYDFVAQGDKVVATGHYAFTVKSTGLGYGADWAHMFTVEFGKIKRFKEFTDTLKVELAYHPQGAVAQQGAAAGAEVPPMH